MSNDLTHFAINADDVERARTFYESVFDWTFTPWGPPGFYQIRTGDGSGVRGAMQERRQLLDGVATTGFECTFTVDDVDDTARRVVDAGGTLLMERFTIEHVGHLIAFADVSGNVALAMEYDRPAD